MKAITLTSGRLSFQRDHGEPTPQGNEVIIDVSQAGICETDLQLARGYMNFQGILGHEFVGVAQSGTFAGQRVVGEINCNCRQCPTCLAGRPTHCPNRTVIGIDRHPGAFAERLAVPEHLLHPVPEAVSDDQAVFVEPLAAAFEILRQVSIGQSDRIAILGDGRLGYLCAQALSLASPRITAFGKHGQKLLRFGHHGHTTVQISSTHPDELPSKQFDVVVDCTGSISGLPMALHLVRPRGTVVMKTTVADPHSLSLATIVIDEITLVGSRCGPFEQALAALDAGTIDVSGLITHRFGLDDVENAFDAATSPNAFKTVFDIKAS